MDLAQAATELEEDLRLREAELVFLENVCRGLPSEQQDMMRRSMLLMLYAHFEGYTKTVFEVYRRHINEESLLCKDVQPELATCALKDVFRAFRNSENAQNFLPSALQSLGDLRPLAIERTLVAEARSLDNRSLTIPEKFIDLESNLKPVVLRKNLYRMGLPHDLFDAHEPIVGTLLGRRNNIAHGAEVVGVGQAIYDEMKDSVIEVMNSLRTKILDSITNRSYIKSAAE